MIIVIIVYNNTISTFYRPLYQLCKTDIKTDIYIFLPKIVNPTAALSYSYSVAQSPQCHPSLTEGHL